MKYLLVIFCLVLVSKAPAQIPDTFENLEILPDDITKRELTKLMRSVSGALGVRCSACHVEKEPGNFMSTDWASDELEMKNTARGMMKMVQEINSNLLPAATGEHDFQVSCYTCHRGLEHPYQLPEVLLKVVTAEGAEAGETRYWELREQYYGSGSYDFGAKALLSVAESMVTENADLLGARQMLNLNLEMFPESGETFLMLAQIDIADGDNEAAREKIDKALALDPENRRAKRMLGQLEN